MHIQCEIQHIGQKLRTEKLQTVLQKIKFKLPKTGSKMTFIPNFCPNLKKRWPCVRPNYSEGFWMFEKIIGLLDLCLGFRCEDL